MYTLERRGAYGVYIYIGIDIGTITYYVIYGLGKVYNVGKSREFVFDIFLASSVRNIILYIRSIMCILL